MNHSPSSLWHDPGVSISARSTGYNGDPIAQRLLAIEGSLFALSFIVIFLRFYVRIFMLKSFGLDDWMMILSAGLSSACLGIFVYICDLGLGLHFSVFPPENVVPFLKIVYFYTFLIGFAYSSIKLSIGFFLLRLADRTRYRTFLIIIMVFIVISTLGTQFAVIFQCTPVRAGWDITIRPPTGTAKCIDPTTYTNIGLLNSGINIFTDLIFALIPIPMIWRLQVNTRTRVGLAAILSLGIFASITAIYKVPLQYNLFKDPDWSGKGSWYYVWGLVEMHVGIIAACLPTLKPLFAQFFGQISNYAFSRDRTGRSANTNTPFRSTGYMKHSDSQFSDSVALKEVNNGSQMYSGNPDEGGQNAAHNSNVYQVGISRSGSKHWRTQSAAGESDDSILAHDDSRTPARGMVILRTTEVNVTH